MAEDLNFLQQKAREWALKVVELHNTKVPAEFEGQKAKLLYAAKTIKDTLEKTIGKASYLEPMNQLGFLPILVGGTVIAGSIAAITKWTLDYKTFSDKIAQQNRLIASGLSPQQAANVVNSGVSFSFSTLAKYALPAFGVGLLAYFLTRKKGV